ncbi:hypothetical protein [Alkalibacterium indicireducens]|uniref:hypothetical protein n=1 Tax=Alkalibacterium indicireducens TaxID=398758 RepID=UPI0031F901B9
MIQLTERLETAFNLTEDLASSLSGEELTMRLRDIPSNTIDEQMWCIVGARESYLEAIIQNKWSGFSCSLTDVTSPSRVLESLTASSVDCLSYLQKNELNSIQTDLLFSLLEHEVQHHGQLIRYVYGNRLSFPKSWKNRYNV